MKLTDVKKYRKSLIVLGVSLVFITTTAESCDDGAQQSDATQTNKQLEQYQKVQPIRFYDWSQYRQTLLSVEDAQAMGTATTSFFFNNGVANPVKSCPSIGYPVPSTAQVTSPDQYYTNGTTTSQMEPTGVYTGDSQGTYVVCVINGKAVPTYWEGNVEAEGGPAHWDKSQSMIVNDGDPTVMVKTSK